MRAKKREMTEMEEIQLKAYLLWEKAGKPEGMSNFFWNTARDEVHARLRAEYDRKVAIEEKEDEKRREVMDVIRSAGHEAYNSPALKNLAASVGINMDRL